MPDMYKTRMSGILFFPKSRVKSFFKQPEFGKSLLRSETSAPTPFPLDGEGELTEGQRGEVSERDLTRSAVIVQMLLYNYAGQEIVKTGLLTLHSL